MIAYGVGFLVAPTVLGYMFGVMDNYMQDIPEDWRGVYENTENIVRWFIPLIPAVGAFLLILKTLMVASARGGD